MAGRKPVPTGLKILRGNPGKRPLPRHEPKPPRGVPICPRGLDHVAKALWQELGVTLDSMQVLTLADGRALELLCGSYSEWRRAQAIIRREGLTYTTRTESGDLMIRPRPEVSIGSDAFRRLRALLTDFGLTPASRAKVSTAGATEVDPFEAFLTQGSGGKA